MQRDSRFCTWYMYLYFEDCVLHDLPRVCRCQDAWDLDMLWLSGLFWSGAECQQSQLAIGHSLFGIVDQIESVESYLTHKSRYRDFHVALTRHFESKRTPATIFWFFYYPQRGRIIKILCSSLFSLTRQTRHLNTLSSCALCSHESCDVFC
jgi:hypothetical protein